MLHHVILGEIQTSGMLGYARICLGIAWVLARTARVLLEYYSDIARVLLGCCLGMLRYAQVCSGIAWVLLWFCSGISLTSFYYRLRVVVTVKCCSLSIIGCYCCFNGDCCHLAIILMLSIVVVL